jgi:hypothetical protein
VKERHRDQRAQLRPEIAWYADTANQVLCVGDERFVGGRHTLGASGRTRGVEECGDITGVGSLRHVGIAVGQRGISGQIHLHTGIAEHEFHFRLGRPRIDDDRDATGQHRTPVGKHPVHARRITHGHPIPGRQPVGAQPSWHPRSPLPQLRIAQPTPADFDDRLGVRARVNVQAQHLAERRRHVHVMRDAAGGQLDRRSVKGIAQTRDFDDWTHDVASVSLLDDPAARGPRPARST